jgi:predicted anti-sigma-YlaC factor YlaD
MNQFKGMDCERIEAMLPAFVGHDVGAEESAAVAAHVDSCERCRESLAAFVLLEQTLVARRSEVPPVDEFLPELRTATARVRSGFVVRCLRAITSVPGVAIVLVMWAVLLVGHFNDRIALRIADHALAERVTAFVKHGLDAMVGVAGGDVWTLTAVYGALAIGLIVSAGALTMRFVRD